MKKRLTEVEKIAIKEFVDALITTFPERVELIRLFGSRARGEGDEGSDLDLLIIMDREDKAMEEKIIQLMSEIAGQYDGHLVAPLTATREELANLNWRFFRVLGEAKRDGIDFFKSSMISRDGASFIEQILEMNLKKRGGNGMEEMIKEHIIREVEEGKECLRATRVLIENNLYSHAISKAYFAMFHLAEAVLLSRKIERRKHLKLIGAFHNQFKKSGEMGRSFHDLLDKAYEDRQKADYKFFKFSKEEAENRFTEAQAFVERMEKWLKENGVI